MDQNSLRVELIETICRLPADRLPAAADALQRIAKGPAAPTAASAANSTTRDWPHAPIHRLSEHGTYIVTTGTYGKQHFFRDAARLTALENALLSLSLKYDWHLEAWAVFSNHYHFVGYTLSSPPRLREFLTELHATTARDVNSLDGTDGRQVWHNFWDRQLTYEQSYLARLNYVHQNAVKHGLVQVAHQYPWCSAAWFERTATPAQVKTIHSFKIDRVRVADDFDPLHVR